MNGAGSNRQWYRDRSSVNLDGVNEYIDLGTSSKLSFGNGTTDSPFSVTAWINMRDATAFRVINKHVSLVSREWVFGTSGGDLLQFVMTDNSTGGAIGRSYSTTLTSFENTWVHVVGTYSGNSTNAGIMLYLNGVRVDTTNAGTGTYVAMETLGINAHIGRLDTASPSFSNGYISDVQVWNKELSLTEIKEVIANTSNNLKRWHSARANLLAYYDMSGATTAANGVKDLSGNQLDGSMQNAESADINPFIPFPRAYQQAYNLRNPTQPGLGGSGAGGFSWNFDGVNEYITKSAFSLNGATTFAFSLWFKTAGSTGSNRYIFSMPEASGGSNGIDLYVGTTGNLIGTIRTTTTATISGGTARNFDNQWHNAIMNYDGANATIYVDGQQYLTAAKTGTVSLTANETNIGRFGSFGGYFPGLVDNVIIFNRNLTTTEIAQVYNGHSPRQEEALNISSAITTLWRGYNSTNVASGVLDQVGSNNATMTNMENADIQPAQFDAAYPRAVYDSGAWVNGATDFTGSFSLDGVNENIDMGDSDLFSFGNGSSDSPFSLSVWFKPTTLGGNKPLIGKLGNAEYEYLLRMATTTSYFTLYHLLGNIYIGRSFPTSSVTINKWNFFTATYDGSGTNAGCKVYVNGSRVDSANFTSGVYVAMSNTTQTLKVGKQELPGAAYAAGKFALPLVWSKELSATETLELYNSGSPVDPTLVSFYRTGATINLVEGWRLNQRDNPTSASGVLGIRGLINATGQNMESGDLVTTDFPTN